MPDDVKSGTSADKSASTSPQLSAADVEAAITKILDSRIPGLMSSFQKQVNAALESREAVNNDEKLLIQMTPEERALKVRENALKDRELAVTKKAVAVELGVDEAQVSGATEVEMRLAATTYLLQHPKVPPTPPGVKPNQPAPAGTPPGGGSTLTPLQKIEQGLREKASRSP